MAVLLDLMTRLRREPTTLDGADPMARSAAIAAHLELVAWGLWRLAFAAAHIPLARREPTARFRPPIEVERALARHWDPHVRAIAALARQADRVASDLRVAIEDDPIPF